MVILINVINTKTEKVNIFGDKWLYSFSILTSSSIIKNVSFKFYHSNENAFFDWLWLSHDNDSQTHFQIKGQKKSDTFTFKMIQE